MNSEIPSFSKDSNASIISDALNRTGVCIVQNYLSEMELTGLAIESKKIFELYADNLNDLINQQVVYLRPDNLNVYGNVINGTNNVIQQFPIIKALESSGRLRDIARSFYKEEQFIFPVRWQLIRSFSSPVDRNQAPYSLHFDRQHFLKFFIYLTDVGPESGALTFLLGKGHRDSAIQIRESYKNKLSYWGDINNNYECEDPGFQLPLYLHAGDLIIFDSNVPHCQGVISGDNYREVIMMECQSREEFYFSDRPRKSN